MKSRKVSEIETLYRTPHAKPNGLAITPEGMWIIDQGRESWISLIDPDSGALIREFMPDKVSAASGLAVDDQGTMWVGSTYNRFIVHLDPESGRTLAIYETPGAGRIYSMKGDPAMRLSRLPPAFPIARAVSQTAPPPALPPGRLPLSIMEAPAGTGAHGLLTKGDLIYVATPPARKIFVVDRRSWTVQDAWPAAGNRSHDMTWADNARTAFWVADSNLHIFVLHDAASGRMLETIRLPIEGPWVVHGAKIYNNYMYICDDMGWMGRFRF